MNQSYVVSFLYCLIYFGCLATVILVLCRIEILLSIFGTFNSSSDSVRLEIFGTFNSSSVSVRLELSLISWFTRTRVMNKKLERKVH